MGAICSKKSVVNKSPSESTLDQNGLRDPEPPPPRDSRLRRKGDSANLAAAEAMEKRFQEQSFSFSERLIPLSGDDPSPLAESAEPQLLRAYSYKSRSARSKASNAAKTGAAKVSEVSLILGKAGSVGLGKAVEVLDTLGSSMTSFHLSTSFVPGVTSKGKKISILAFEVANTIVKGSNLMQSLSKENVKHLKEAVLPSEGVQNLISKDMDELLRITAADKREQLNVFSKEVIRFGNRCKDPQWHNLERYFDKLWSEIANQSQLKEVAETTDQLMRTVQYTAELYHELHTLDRFEQDYNRKHQEEENPSALQRGDNIQILKQELKSQKKHVKSLKKRSLWSRNLEEVMEKLVDIVHFLHLEIHEAFGSSDTVVLAEGTTKGLKSLGPAGLALHYANIISQIDTIVSRSGSVPPNTRDNLYQGLPPAIKNVFRSRLQSLEVTEELTVPQVKAEMEKTLRWLVPLANNTTKAHHGFGWVGEWANTGTELNRKPSVQTDLIRIETLHHADKEKTEAYILDLVVWLHHLTSLSRSGNGGKSPIKSPVRSPTKKGLTIASLNGKQSITTSSVLTQEDQEMLREVNFRKLVPGISKSQEFDTVKSRSAKHSRLSKSNSHSPTSSSKKDLFSLRRLSMLPVIDFDIDRTKALDVIDRVDDETLNRWINNQGTKQSS